MRLPRAAAAAAAAAVMAFSTCCESAEDDESRWRTAGVSNFLDHLLVMGCDQCEVFLTQAELQHRPKGWNPPFQISTQQFGCADVDVLLPTLHWIYETTRRQQGGRFPGLLVDGGANVGRATSRWMSAFGDIHARRVAQDEAQAPCVVCSGTSATEGDSANNPPNVVVVSVEPSQSNFVKLMQAASEEHWQDEGWIGIEAALGSEQGESWLAVSKEFAIDEVATMLYLADDPREKQRVRVITIADAIQEAASAFPELPIAAQGIFLLKLDIEGMEPSVLRSTRALSASMPVKFITFEYASNVWQEPLEGVLDELWDAGYMCFLMTSEQLFPTSGPFWDPIYTLPLWSNFFCGRVDDAGLEAVVQLHSGLIGLWPMVPRMYLDEMAETAGSISGYSLPEAQQRCLDIGLRCGGVTCSCEGDSCRGAKASITGIPPHLMPRSGCTPRIGADGLRLSPSLDEISFLRDPVCGDAFLLYRRHVRESCAASQPRTP